MNNKEIPQSMSERIMEANGQLPPNAMRQNTDEQQGLPVDPATAPDTITPSPLPSQEIVNFVPTTITKGTIYVGRIQVPYVKMVPTE